MRNKDLRRIVFYFLKYNKKLALPAITIFGILFVLIDGIDDQKAIELYIEKLQSLSTYRIDDNQKYSITYHYLNDRNKYPSKNQRKKIRDEFNLSRNNFKQKWSLHYSLIWPTEKYQITTNNKLDHGKPFQVHHIIPINSGGINQLWNLTPLSNENHKELHASIEEHSCFSHDMLERKIYRFILKIKVTIYEFAKKIFGHRDQTESSSLSKSCSTA